MVSGAVGGEGRAVATWRLFIAVELPEAVRRVLSAVQRELATAGADVKWSRAETIHLTLKFLGDTAEGEVPRLAAALDAAAAAGHGVTARLDEVGAFPNVRRPRVIWVGLNEPTGELAALQKRVDEAARDLVAPDPRGFAAHLTLGRTRSGKNAARLAAMMEGYRLASAAEVPVREVVLMRSVLRPGGPIYTVLHRSSVGG